jgi:glycosyltransferase involved in cell wall biosynthesis
MAASKQRHICMIAYTNYAFDARVRREAEALVEDNCSVVCLTPRNGKRRKPYQVHGVWVRELRVPKYRGKNLVRYFISYLRFLLQSSIACNALLLRGRMDAVHVHNLPDFLVFAALLPRIKGKPVVLDIHDSVPETFGTKFERSSGALFKVLCWEERISAALAHRIICVNELQKQALVERGIPAEKIFVSMNVPDHRVFSPEFRRNGNRASGFRVIYHGTMARRLGVDLIIQAVARLHDRIPGLQLHLWGDGDDLPEFQRTARLLRIDHLVHFNPNGVPFDQLPQHLQLMDVGVVGNRRNPATDLMLPVKMLECVALGIPVVAPRLRTIQHYFDEKMVHFYEPENIESLAQALIGVAQDRQSAELRAGRAESFLQEFGWHHQSSDFLKFYSGLLEG